MATTSTITDPISNRDAIGSVDSADSILILDATDSTVKKATVSQLPSGSGVSDGDKGDITVSGSGTTWTIDAGVVGTSKLGGDITTAGKALLDDADNTAQRTTLGLGTAATANTGDFAAASHTHAASAITSGTIDTARLGSGTANSTTFLRGDQTWATPAGGSLTVQEGDVTVSSAVTTLDFGSGFDVTESPAGEANIALDLTEAGIGTLPIGSGGTGQTSQTAAFDALAPTTTGGDLIYYNGTDNVRLAAGTQHFQHLVTGGTSAQPTWNNTWYSIFATGTQDVSNNSTLQNDNTLIVNCTTFGTGTYAVRMVVYLNAQNAAADVRYGFTTTGTMTVTGIRRHIIVGATTETIARMDGISSLAAVDLTATVTGQSRVEMDFRLVCTVAGSWTFQFAQVTPSLSGASQRLSGSYIEFMKVA